MSWLSLDRARTRIALSGALVVCALFLGALALGARARIRALAFEEIDEELDTLSVAIGSDYELVGLKEEERQALKAGLEANMFEFRLANHSAILFNGEVPVALTGNLLRAQERVSLANYLEKPEVPYTAIEPYSGQNRTCRFLVTHLQGKAKGATLVVFRWIGPTLRSLARVDNALGGMVVVGFLGTAGILAFAVHRAIRPVEEVTLLAEEAEATDLSRRVRVSSGGEEFRRLAAVINSLFDRLERAFRAQRRLVADAAHELKTPDRRPRRRGAGRAAARGDGRGAPPLPRRRSPTPPRGSRARWTGCCCSPAATRRRRAGPRSSTSSDVAEEALAAVAGLGARRNVLCAVTRSGDTRLRGERAGLLRLVSNLVSNAILYIERRTPWSRSRSRGRATRSSLEVADHGPGIAQGDRERIFERFVRLDEDARAQSPGLGARPRDRRAGRRGPRRLGRGPRKRGRRRRLPRHAAGHAHLTRGALSAGSRGPSVP